ncbi:hypothetical protein EfmJHP35_28610 [Enterococcus faecium]|nr:hypothetical protein EfmJHP35_28610 [Enterococcus faecium]
MIKLVRVDHRLLHGQVIFSWTKQYDINHIIVADNKVPGDPMSVMALTIAKPADCKLDIVKISDVKGIMETSPNDNYMILIKGPKEAFEFGLSFAKQGSILGPILAVGLLLYLLF